MSAGADAVRIGLVGCGRLAEQGYVPALAQVPTAHLVGLADPDPIRRERVAGIAAARGVVVPTFASTASLLARVPVDAVILATPASVHLDDARAAAGAGVAVLVEKPPAPDADGAAALAALTPPPWIAFNRRFDAGVGRLRAHVPADADVDLRLSIVYRRRAWRAHVVDDDALDDLGPHLIDWARWLTGCEVDKVTTRRSTAARLVLDLELERGRARITAATDRPYREVIECRRRDGRRIARWSRGGPVAAVTDRLSGGDHPLATTLAAQLRTFVTAVGGDVAPDLATAADGLAVMRVIDAARASARADGAPTRVRRPPPPPGPEVH